MTTITLFEHQTRTYAELGWDPDCPALGHLESVNEAAGTDLVRLERRKLRATQFVGVIRLGQITLQIVPKIDFDPAGTVDAALGSAPHLAAVASATRNLLYLLSYTHDLEIRAQDAAPMLTRRSDWFELLTRLLAMNLHTLMKRGVERSYVEIEDRIPVMRGRWQIARQLTRRPHVRHKFDVVYDEFSSDTALNQVFRFAVSRLLVRTQDQGSRRLLRDIREWLADITDPDRVSEAYLDSVHFTRLNDRFRPAFNLARLFIESRAFQFAAGEHETFAFVFDMNRLFEQFVARFIARHRRRVLPDEWTGIRIRRQGRGRPAYLAERLPGEKRVFRLVPDLLFTRPSGVPLLVLDTKYKQLERGRSQFVVSTHHHILNLLPPSN